MTAQEKALDVARGASCAPTTAAEFTEAVRHVRAVYIIDADTMNRLNILADLQSGLSRKGCPACGRALTTLLARVVCELDLP